MVGISNGKIKILILSAWVPKILANKNFLLNINEIYTHSKRGRLFRDPPPLTIYLRTDDVRDNIHSHLCHAKCPMTVRGGGGGAMAVSRGRGVIFVLKFKNCIQKGSLHTNFIKTLILL